ncbi:MAG: hypothetical protein ACRCTY_09630 [Candidatus Adiutrix sp.]
MPSPKFNYLSIESMQMVEPIMALVQPNVNHFLIYFDMADKLLKYQLIKKQNPQVARHIESFLKVNF